MAARGNGKPLPVATAEALLAVNDSEGKPFEIKEWGVSVLLRGLTRGEARLCYELTDLEAREASMLNCAFVEPKLTPDQSRDLVKNKSFGVTEKLLERVLELSGLAEPDVRLPAEAVVEGATRNEDGTVTIPAPLFSQLEVAVTGTFR